MKRITIATVLGILFSLPVLASTESEVRARADEFVAAWNKHDSKAMADLWATDGDLINPAGRAAKGRAEVEKLFRDEHGTVMKKSTYKNVSSSVRVVEPELALGDWDVEISGMVGPDGAAAPVQKTHVNSLMKKASGKWWIVAARAYNYVPMPAAPKKK